MSVYVGDARFHGSIQLCTVACHYAITYAFIIDFSANFPKEAEIRSESSTP